MSITAVGAPSPDDDGEFGQFSEQVSTGVARLVILAMLRNLLFERQLNEMIDWTRYLTYRRYMARAHRSWVSDQNTQQT